MKTGIPSSSESEWIIISEMASNITPLQQDIIDGTFDHSAENRIIC